MNFKRNLEISKEIPVASMSDMAFILIVFFMVVAVFTIEVGVLLKLPTKDKVAISQQDQKIIEVIITHDNKITIDQQTMDSTMLKQWLGTHPVLTHQAVAIKAHGQSHYQTLVLVIEAFKQQGLNKIAVERLLS